MGIETSFFGKTRDGQNTHLYKLYNDFMECTVTDYGACLVSVWFRDKRGRFRDVVLGYDTLPEYEVNRPSLGAIIGRNANRIGKAEALISGQSYALEKNEGENNLHSGSHGYQHRVWEAWTDEEDGDSKVTFLLDSPHLDQGFPGKAKVAVTYTLTAGNELRIDYRAKADADTIFNMTNHSYFNLEGQESGSVLGHMLRIDADAYTEADAEQIPTGRIVPVDGTPMDFRQERRIGDWIGEPYEPLALAGGYDHNWVLNHPGSLRPAAWLYAPESGICLEVETDLPGLQVYTANYLEDEKGKEGTVYQPRSGICFETQHYPDACHHGNFPDSVVKAGQRYETSTIFRFSRRG